MKRKGDDKEIEYVLTPELVSQKLELFLEQKSAVHLALSNGRWMNGYVVEINHVKKFFIFKEFVYGETPLFINEVVAIEPFKRRKEE